MPLVDITISEALEAKIKPFETWLPVILEVSVLNLTSPARLAAVALVEFLMTNPSPREVAAHKLPERFQERVETLLEHNRANTLSKEETRELDDYLKFEHAARMMKLRTKAGTLKPGSPHEKKVTRPAQG